MVPRVGHSSHICEYSHFQKRGNTISVFSLKKSPWWEGGRKDKATTNMAGASSWDQVVVPLRGTPWERTPWFPDDGRRCGGDGETSQPGQQLVLVFFFIIITLMHSQVEGGVRAPVHNMLFGQYVFLPTEQAETYLKITKLSH